ncbi:HNH endonuclease signature motif containing protein [Gordonia caeni]|uniref:HNH endonuclease signature motif containing protein n=1 Tax=Gordonia caeni TaxID=1007097 RepID=A0ABP7PVB0_9ACTN
MIAGSAEPLGYDPAAAAPVTPDDLAETTGVQLPDSPELLWKIIDTAAAKLADTELSGSAEHDLAAMVEVSERLRRRLDGLSAHLYLECSDRQIYRLAGYLDMGTYLGLGHRLNIGETRRRATLAHHLPRHTALTGQRLEPVMPAAADAVADGVIGAAHTLVIAEILNKVPDRLGPEVKADVETQLVEAAHTLRPRDLNRVGLHILAHIDPDGRYTDPDDRQRQRSFYLHGQDDQLMTRLGGQLTPAARAKLELLLNRWAAPGINNPADPHSPHPADTPDDDDALEQSRLRDQRSPDQRNHDAFEAMLDFVLAHYGLGRPDRIPAELVITVSDQDLARHAGVGLTTTGTLLPVADLIELAATNQAVPYLAVFRHHTQQPLYLGKAKKHRFASKAQRLMLFARDRGCTAPGCHAPFIRTQAHHSPDWTRNGRTDIDALGSACGGHNRWVGPHPGQWETNIQQDGPNAGRMTWRPTTTTGPFQLNPIHHPELINTRGAHAPPPIPAHPTTGDDPIRANDSRSRHEKELEARLGITLLRAS